MPLMIGQMNVYRVKKNQKYFKKVKLILLNKIIIFSIQRLDFNNNIKNNSSILFDEFINLKDFIDNDSKELQSKYKLFATIHHIGDIDSRHYLYCYKKR